MKIKSFFYYVVKRGFLEIVGFLIEEKVFVNICDNEGKLLLYWVV